jgi:coatomer subunit beta
VYKHFKEMYPDAPDDVEKLLEEEGDPATRRNAFVMMFQVALDRALQYLARNLERVTSFGDGFALILLDLIRKVARGDASRKAKFIRIVFALLENTSSAVTFEAASTLTALSTTPSAIRAAAGAFIKILNRESDNNVKLIVLDRLAGLRRKHSKVLREMVMDILRALSSPNNDIRRRCLDVAMDLVTPRNVDEVMATLKKEIVSTSSAVAASSGSGSGASSGGVAAAGLGGAGSSSGSSSGGSDGEALRYRTMLITAIHGCAVRFPDVAPQAVHLLMDFLSGADATGGALTAVEFVREIVELCPAMRAGVISKLREVMPDIAASDVYRVALWLLGQYSTSDAEVDAAIHTIRQCIGPLPLNQLWSDFVASQKAAREAAAPSDKAAAAPAKKSGPIVLADGTYASQSAVTDDKAGGSGSGGDNDDDLDDAGLSHEDILPKLRQLLLSGDFFLGSVVSSTLTKLALRVSEHRGREDRHTKSVMVDAMLVMCSIIELGASGLACTNSLLPQAVIPQALRIAAAAGVGGFKAAGTPAANNVLPGASSGAAAAATQAAAHSSGVRIDQDSFERIVLCMRVLGDPNATAATLPVLLHSCKDAFSALLQERKARIAQAAKEGIASFSAVAGAAGSSAMMFGGASSSTSKAAGGAGANTEEAKAALAADLVAKAQVDDCFYARLLSANKGLADDFAGPAGSSQQGGGEDDFDPTKAMSGVGGGAGGSAFTENFSERLKRVHQLTGFSDPIYAEAFVKVHEYDVILEITLINRTDQTLTNVAVELSTMGDLRLVERPPSFTLAPKDSRTIKANIKVSSTETGHIFGTIVYDSTAGSSASTASGGDRTSVINLCELHLDIMDYIHPAHTSDASFRSMWSDFEWENKVNVNTNLTNLQEFIRHVAKVTNMRILTPVAALGPTVNFLAANLYARSVFGEDALVNISVENRADGGIRGHIRIRAKTQGVALSLGDRITAKQKV